MANLGPQGWATDPFGLHEARYFSAGQPTKLVRDGGVESFDEPPSNADGLAVVTARATAVLEPPGFDRPHEADSGDTYRYDPGSARVPRPRPWDGVAWAAIAILAAAALVIGVVVTQTPKTAPATTLDTTTAATVAFVAQSAQRTLGQRTADVTVSGTVRFGSQTIPTGGTGEVNFTTNAMTLDTTFTAAGRSTTEKEILVNESLYQMLIVDVQGQPQPGHLKWIQMPVQQATSANLTGSDPLASLTTLEQQGYTVQALGTKLIDNVTCTGFAVTPSRQAMISAAQKEASELGLSPALTTFEVGMARIMQPATITVWIDPHQLVREMGVSIPSLEFNGSAVSGSIIMDFSHFGVPVRITAPPSADTVSLSSYLKALGLSGLQHALVGPDVLEDEARLGVGDVRVAAEALHEVTKRLAGRRRDV